MAEHIVRAFGEALDELTSETARMGELAVRQLNDALAAVRDRDVDLAAAVVLRDRELDALQTQMEHAAVRLLALRQPLAGDLRATLAAIKVAGDLERCGDLAKSIAKRVAAMGDSPAGGGLTEDIQRLGRLASERLARVVAAHAAGDLDAALAVWREDEAIDQAFEALFEALVRRMAGAPEDVQRCAHLLFVAKNLERVGDHATNIAEMVVYRLTGEDLAAAERPRGLAS